MADENGFVRYTEPPTYLNAVDVNNFMNNIQVVITALKNKGFRVEDFTTTTVGRTTRLYNVRTILNRIEEGLDILNNARPSEYYVSSRRYGSTVPTKRGVQRWIDVLNDLYDRFAETESVNILKCTDGYPTIDGKRISVLDD